MSQAATPPSCMVSAQLVQADDRYARRLERDARMRHGMVDALTSTMGFCTRHRAWFSTLDTPLGRWADDCAAQAQQRLAELFTRARLQDEFLQDILFGARSRCPACAFARRLENRLLARLVRDIEGKRVSVREVFATGLCFEYARRLTERAEGTLRSTMARALRKKADGLIELARLAPPEAGADSDARHTLMAAVFPLAARTTTTAREPAAECHRSHCTCPVCAGLEDARKGWLGAVADNIRLEQPAWLTLPTCADHVVQCLGAGLALPPPAIVQRYVESALMARKPRPLQTGPKKRRRSSILWFDATPARTAEAAGEAQTDAAATPEQTPEETAADYRCPGCQAEDIAMRAAIAQVLRALARAAPEHASDMLEQLCLKHFAEALIVAPDVAIHEHFLRFLKRRLDGARDRHPRSPIDMAVKAACQLRTA